MKNLINKLRWILGLPFIGVAIVFYAIHTLIDPYTNWELDQFELFDYYDWYDEDDWDGDCC